MGINIKPRLSWLDNSKMLAMLLVIIYHVGSFANDYIVNKNEWSVSSTGYVIVDVCVALLVALVLSMLTILICKLLSKIHISRMLVLGEK